MSNGEGRKVPIGLRPQDLNTHRGYLIRMFLRTLRIFLLLLSNATRTDVFIAMSPVASEPSRGHSQLGLGQLATLHHSFEISEPDYNSFFME